MVVDADSLMYLLGTKIDFKEDDISAEFVFDNPLVCFFVCPITHRQLRRAVAVKAFL